MHIHWNRVTWYSQAAALVIFVGTFVLAFYLGISWERAHIETALTEVPVVATTTPAATDTIGGTLGAHCGGFIKDAPTCADGFHCQLTVGRPDTGGTCVADTAATGPAPATVTQDMPASGSAVGTLGAYCGGNSTNVPQCNAGLHCDLVDGRTDGGGTCVLNQKSTSPIPTSAP